MAMANALATLICSEPIAHAISVANTGCVGWKMAALKLVTSDSP